MSNVLKYGIYLLAILLIGILVAIYFRDFFGAIPSIIIVLDEIAKQPGLMAAFTIISLITMILALYLQIKQEKINLPPIDSVIPKHEKESFDDFLRRGKDPYMIDFKNGYITKRKEVDGVINKLKKDPIQLIIGDPASGKTVIAKNMGYKFRKKKYGFLRYNVFIIKIKDKLHRNDVNEILKIKKKRILLIIDDIHSDLNGINDLLEIIGKPKFKILLCGRAVIERKVEQRSETQLDRLMQDEKKSTKINAFNAVNDILKNFEDKTDIKIKEEHRVEFKKQYGQDLWVLSRTLSFYKIKGRVPTREELYDEIKGDLKKDDYREIHADDIILPISLFYRHETSIAVRTLTETLGLNEGDIWKLINRGEILELDGQLSLHHSSRATLYIETFKEDEKLGENVKETIQKKLKFGDWYIGLYHLYFRSMPKVCLGTLSCLSNEYKRSIIKKDIICELLKDNETKNAIFENIVESMEVKNVVNLKNALGSASNRTFSKEFLEYFSEEDLLEFLNNSKINQLGSFLWKGYYSINVQNVYRRFSRESFLLRKMNDATLGEIGVFIYGIRQVKFKKNVLKGAELALDAIEKLKEVDNLPQKLEEATLKNISLLIQNINEVGGDPKFIIDKLSPPFDLIKQMEESTLDYIGLLIVDLRRNAAEHLIEGFDLAGKVEESSLIELGYFVWHISADQSLSVKYNKIIEDQDLVEKIEMSDLNTINHFLWNLFQTSSSVPKTFTDTKVRNAVLNGKLNIYNKENVGEKLCLIGIFEYAGCSLLEDDDEKISEIKITHTEQKVRLKKYLESYNPFKIALALKGFRAIDEKNTISFINSHLSLKEVIECLQKLEIKNSKTKQLIGDMLRWLNYLHTKE